MGPVGIAIISTNVITFILSLVIIGIGAALLNTVRSLPTPSFAATPALIFQASASLSCILQVKDNTSHLGDYDALQIRNIMVRHCCLLPHPPSSSCHLKPKSRVA